MRLAPLLVLPLLLAACGTPQEQCIRPYTKELRQVDALIAETRANLARGYGYREDRVTDWDYEPCYWGRSVTPGGISSRSMCWEPYERTVRTAVAVDPASEERKLAALTQRRTTLAKRIGPAVAACKAQYPE
ncbi:MAG: hypothetical protein LCH69_08200 [Proteobacteria bacterium]|nr:hypothetical protein [Pseudomonadota bacterium]